MFNNQLWKRRILVLLEKPLWGDKCFIQNPVLLWVFLILLSAVLNKISCRVQKPFSKWISGLFNIPILWHTKSLNWYNYLLTLQLFLQPWISWMEAYSISGLANQFIIPFMLCITDIYLVSFNQDNNLCRH